MVRSKASHRNDLAGGLCPPFFIGSLAGHDRRVLERQMSSRRFDASVGLGVVRRCRWGFPQVILCRPLVKNSPFPTSFWLSCPHLDLVCGQREATGGVRALEDFLEGDSPGWVRYHMLHVLFRLGLLPRGEGRFLFRHRRGLWTALRSGGVGGIRLRDRITVKCLHLQTASWLALGTHPGAAWLEREIAPLDCDCPEAFPCGASR